MDFFQRERRESLDSITKPIQAKEKSTGGGGTDAGAAPGAEGGPAGEREDAMLAGAEGEGAEGAGTWNADADLMSAMGLSELGAEAGNGGGEAGDGQGSGGTDRAKRAALAKKKAARRKQRGAPKGESAVPGTAGEAGAAGAGAAGAANIQRKEAGVGEVGDLLGGRGAATTASALGSIPTSGGAPVDRGIAAGVERATGQSVGDVRVHTDSASAAAANAISARAFTSGNNIHMAASESPGDARLMSHELAHTIQQTQAAKVADGVSRPGDSLEVEADRVADAAVSGGTASVTTGAGGSLMRDAVSDVEALLSYGAFDWTITDSEATQALSILSAMPTAALGAALGRLGQTYKTRLLENLPEAAKRTSGYTKVLVALGPDAVLPYLSGLLSYGAFDWAVTDSDAAQVFEILRALPGSQAALTTKLGPTFRARLSSNLKRVSVIGPEEHALLRVLFDGTPEAEVQTLCNWTALRFNLKVAESTDADGAPWDKRGLLRCWNVLQALPPEHVENNSDLKSLTRYRNANNSISGWANSKGEAALGYGDGSNLDTAKNNSNAGDPLNGVNRFDKVVRHEVGHRVDARVGGPAYCATADGGGWEKHDTGGMAERMVAASGGKIASWANADQKKAIIDCLQSIVSDRKPGEIDKRLEKLDFVSKHATDAAQAKLLADIKGDAAVTQLSACFENQSPWYNLAGGGTPLGGRIYQEAYKKEWVSYKPEARAKKMSQYQFRAPEEWFAEAYAAYYEPPGAKGALLAGRDDATKAWFDASVDPQNGAGGTVPAGAAPAGGPPGPAPAPAGP